MEKEIARILKEGAALREASYNEKTHRYEKSCMIACAEASPNDPRSGWLIGLALDGWWNDALDWAKDPHD